MSVVDHLPVVTDGRVSVDRGPVWLDVEAHDPRRPTDDQPVESRRTRRGWPQGRVAAAVAIVVVALLPMLAVLLQRWGHPYVPVADQAVEDLRIRDVWTFSADTPLTGPYSRFGWDHPGPMLYYLLAPFSWALRQRAWSLIVGNVVLQGLAVAWTARLSWKWGGLRWMVPWVAVITLAYWATGPAIFQQLWNPYLPFPFFTLFLLQAWLVAAGQTRRLVGMAFVASLLVQTHIGYALPVAAVGTWALVRLGVTEHRAGRSLRTWSIWRLPLLVVGVLWFVPVVVDTVVHPPGNLVRLIQYYLGHGTVRLGPVLGIHGALGYLATEFRWRPPWLGGPDPAVTYSSLTLPSSVAWMVVPVVLIGASWGLARWRRRDDLCALAELLAVAVVAGTAALSVLTGEALPYLFLWRIPVGAATVVLSLVVVVETLRGGHRWALPALCCLLAAVTVMASVSVTRAAAASDGPVAPMEPVAASILTQLQHGGQPRGAVLVRTYGSLLGGLGDAVVDHLAAEGRPVYVDRGLGHEYGYLRTASASQVGAVWFVIEESELYSILSRAPGARVLAVSHPLPARRQAELVALQRTLADQLATSGQSGDTGDLMTAQVAEELSGTGLPRSDLDRLQALNKVVVAHTCLCAVVAFRPDQIPSFVVASS